MAGAAVDWFFDWLSNRIFAVSPTVGKKNGVLTAKTSVKAMILSFGCASREVTIDPLRRLIRIRKRTFWFAHHTRFIPFDAVREVLYSYSDISVGAGWAAHQEDELFTVGLRLEPAEELLLFRFYGYGGFVNDGVFPDWFYWGEMLEDSFTANSKEGEARRFAEVLSGLVGVPIGSPRP